MLVWQPLRGVEWLGLLFLGPLAIAAQYFNIRGYRLANASLLGPVTYSRLVFAAALGFAFFDEKPTWATLLGGSIIIVGGLMLARLHKLALPAEENQD